MLFGLLSTWFCGKAQIFVLEYLNNMLIHNLRNVGGPLLWEALGHGLLGLGLKRVLDVNMNYYYVWLNHVNKNVSYVWLPDVSLNVFYVWLPDVNRNVSYVW